MNIRIIAWKEIIDLIRDKRTLVVTVLLPLLGMPALALVAGALASAQVVHVYIAYSETQSKTVAEKIASEVLAKLNSQGLKADVKVGLPPRNLSNVDVYLLLPRGFYENLTSIGRPVIVYLKVLVGSVSANMAKSAIRGVLNDISWSLAYRRVSTLAKLANITLNPWNVLIPLRIVEGYYKPGGAPASSTQAEVATTARLIELGLFFVVNPAIVYITDAILGEKERRTVESLLITPTSTWELLAGKLIATSLIGFVAAMADTAGLFVYFMLLARTGLKITLGLIALHAITSAVLVFMTASTVIPFVARSQSVRAGQSVAVLFTSLAAVIYFAALLVDLTKLPFTVRAILYLIPFTHAALAIHYYILGMKLKVLVHEVIMLAFTAASLLAGAKIFSSEKLILYVE